MKLREMLLGRRLRSEESEDQAIGTLAGVPVLGLDALASAAYGPEAALTVLLPLGVLAPRYILPISVVVIGVLLTLAASYRQTLSAYPHGGGSYTVASENLGQRAGLLAASALALDYVLNAAVAISAGVGAIVSAVPALLPYTLPLCLALLALLTLVNLRGVREAGLLFMLPTYAFVAALGVTVAVGVHHVAAGGVHPVSAPPRLAASALAAVGPWLLLRAFASGCTAMTGVEAVSNGVPMFRQPREVHAQRTLAAIVAILAVLLGGIAVLCRAYGIGARPPGQAGYESVLSQLVRAVMGTGAFYYAALASIFAVLALSANTSFAGFPRLCRMLALDEYLPAEFAHLGRRLVYSQGIVVLAVLSGVLLVVFGGVTDRLIPLFAVGAFLAFTLSQAGMVVHWRRVDGRGARARLLLNGVGALATGATLLVVVVSKFMEGAWITVVVVPGLVLLFSSIHRFLNRTDRETEAEGPLALDDPPPPVVVVPVKRLDRIARKAIRLAITLSPDVRAVHVLTGEPNLDDVCGCWDEWVAAPIRAAGFPAPRLVALPSAYRELFGPLLDYAKKVADENPGRYVAVVVPEQVERRWYHFILHSHRATLLKGLLLLRGGPQIVVLNTPWYLRE